MAQILPDAALPLHISSRFRVVSANRSVRDLRLRYHISMRREQP
jgi:hypothetical protein